MIIIYIEHFILVSTVTGIPIPIFALLTGIPIDIVKSAVGIKILIITGRIKNY